jgi:hypothetical protein
MSSNLPEFPPPYRHRGRLMWDRHGFENYKRALMGLPPLERDPHAPIVFVTATQLAEELPYGRRTIGRRVKGRFADNPAPQPPAAEASAGAA